MTEKESKTQLPPCTEAEKIVDDFCLACGGKCCKHFTIIAKPGEMMRGLLGAHYGTEVQEVKFHVKHVCPHLSDDGLCDLWNEDAELDTRPDFCKNFLCDRARSRTILVECGEQDIEI